MSTTTARPPLATDPATLKVLDLGTLVAGPVTATLLGDMGAEVVKVEQPDGGDFTRRIGPGTHGMSDLWLVEGRNKRSVTIDLRHPGGQELVRELACWADVLVENFRPGTMDRWNLGYEALREHNPRLVYVSASAFGQTGPYRERAGIDRVATAFSGHTYVTGHPDSPPVRPGYAIADYATAMFCALGALEAVRRRDAADGTGQGDWVDVALYEPLLRVSEFSVPHYVHDGVVRERLGNVSASSTPSDVYRTADGHWLTAPAPSDALYRKLMRLMGREDLIERQDLATPQSRMACAAEIDEAVGQWMARHDRADVLKMLGEAGVPAASINSIADIAADEHVRARGNLVEVPVDTGGTVTMQNVLPRMVEQPNSVRWAGEPLGASTGEVLGALGIGEERLAALRAQGVV